jgi:hypothetical protein
MVMDFMDALWVLERVMGLISKCGHKQISLYPPRSRTKQNII